MGADILMAFTGIQYDAVPTWGEAFVHITELEGLTPEEKFDLAKSLHAFKNLFEDYNNVVDRQTDYRQTDYLELKDCVLFFSGGMSWEHSRTDMFNIISELSEYGVLYAAGFDHNIWR